MKRSSEGIKKNYLYQLLYQLAAAVFPLITTPYIARVLGADGTGAYSYTLSVVTYFCLAGNLGISSYGQLEAAGLRNDRNALSVLFAELQQLKLMLSAIALCGYWGMIFISHTRFASLFGVMSIQIIASAVDITWFLQGLEEFRRIVIRNFLTKLAGTILIFIMVRGRSGLNLYAFVSCGTVLAGNLAVWPFLMKTVDHKPASTLHPLRHLRPCILYFIPAVATTIYLTIDKSMLGWITGNTLENGYYEQAQRIEHMAATAVTSVSVVAVPGMAYFRRTGDQSRFHKRLHNTVRFVILISVPMCVGICCLADEFIPLFLGAGYERSVLLLRILSVLLIVIGLNNAVGKQVLMAGGRQNLYNKGVLSGMIVNIIMNAVLITRYQAAGAAAASVAAESVVLAMFLAYANNEISIGDILRCGRKSAAGAVLMGAVLLWVRRCGTLSWTSFMSKTFIGISVYVLVLWLLKDEMIVSAVQWIRRKEDIE